jgi:DNA-binding XRE family transcriptional regulator
MPENKIKDFYIKVRIYNNQLLERRLSKGLTLARLAKQVGVATQSYWRYETFQMSPVSRSGEVKPSAQDSWRIRSLCRPWGRHMGLYRGRV